jgi:purine nucleosidase
MDALLEKEANVTCFVIDTDPGVDDALAIMLAFAHPGAQVEAISTMAGKVPLARTTASACTILDVLEHDVPVYAGRGRPLVADLPSRSQHCAQG